MSTQKRRTVWIADEDWAVIEARASKEGLNVSQLLRVTFVPMSPVPVLPPRPPSPDWAGMQATAADIAKRARAIAAEPNPYRAFTPAPKPGAKRHG